MPGWKGKRSPAHSVADSAPRSTAAEKAAQRPIDAYVGGRLKALREASRKTPSEVSIEAGIPEESITKYERGEQRPPSGDLIALSKLFGVTLAELFPESPGQLTGQLH